MYVITGATGNTGHVIVEQLLAKGQKVRAIGRNAERLKAIAAKGAEPFVADLTDQRALTQAFTGARAVYAMIPPPHPGVENYRAYQERTSDSITDALAASEVAYAVTLSSVGADKPEKTGPVVGLHNFEQKLNRIAALNVLHLRPGYFMENTFAQVDIIQAYGMAASPLRRDLKLPMIATKDIGAAAAEELLKLEFRQKQTRELLGPRDITYQEVASIIGKAIGRPNLAYQQLPDEQLRPAMIKMGMSPDIVDLILEMCASMNSGYMRPLEPRSPRNTTPTSYEQFVADVFVPLYQQKTRAA